MADGEWLLVVGGVALALFMVLAANKRARGKPVARGLGGKGTVPAKTPGVPLSFETGKSASLYRTGDKAYLMVHVLITNDGDVALVIRSIEAAMGNEKGVMAREKFTARATHLGQRSSYSFGSSENLLPLSMTGKTSRDAYLCFAFSNAGIEAGGLVLKAGTSEGETTVPLDVCIVG
ncbi:MAG: hypothetical protein FWB79_04300 [Treponema sp.]|nr:hypothetical protein [Treponema sp.]